jgi:CO/xanthine dehydrogenase FAD-binding subunit
VVASPFEYLRADSYQSAVHALARYGAGAKILAGGQSLVPLLSQRHLRPAALIDIGEADDRGPSSSDGTLHLPGLTRQRALAESPVVRQNCPLLAVAAEYIGNIRVRTRGTLAGSLAHALPAAELCVASLALGGRVSLLGPAGGRVVPAEDFFAGQGTTACAPDEVITDVTIPPAPRSGWSFLETSLRAQDSAVVAVAALIRLRPGEDRVADVRLALGGVADRPVLVLPALSGATVDDALARELAATVAASVSPPTDARASAAYRKRLLAVLARRALRQAFDRARGIGR